MKRKKGKKLKYWLIGIGLFIGFIFIFNITYLSKLEALKKEVIKKDLIIKKFQNPNIGGRPGVKIEDLEQDKNFYSDRIDKTGWDKYGKLISQLTCPLNINTSFITAEFGPDSFSYLNTSGEVVLISRNHSGIDLTSKSDHRVFSASSGKVVKIKYDDTYYGKLIVVESFINGEYLRCGYGHLDKIFVKEGDVINQGDMIAKLGESGNSYGRHLHFSLMVVRGNSYVCVNPLTNAILHKTLTNEFYYADM